MVLSRITPKVLPFDFGNGLLFISELTSLWMAKNTTYTFLIPMVVESQTDARWRFPWWNTYYPKPIAITRKESKAERVVSLGHVQLSEKNLPSQLTISSFYKVSKAGNWIVSLSISCIGEPFKLWDVDWASANVVMTTREPYLRWRGINGSSNLLSHTRGYWY